MKKNTKGSGELHILITREPYAWLESMSRNAHYAKLHQYASSVWGFEDFLSLEWAAFTEAVLPVLKLPTKEQKINTMISHKSLDSASYNASLARLRMSTSQIPYDTKSKGEMWIERDQDTKTRYPNIAAMREGKLRDWLRFAPQLDRTMHISCEDYMHDPVAVLSRLHTFFGLTRLNTTKNMWDLRSCKSNFGNCKGKDQNWDDPDLAEKRNYYALGRYFQKYDNTTLALANAFLDPELEKLFGYRLIQNLEDFKSVLSDASTANVPKTRKTQDAELPMVV